MDALAALDEGGLDDDEMESVLHANCAAVFLQVQDFERALESSKISLDCNPHNIKACFRDAQAARKLGKLERAATLCERGLRQAPDDPALRDLKQCLMHDKWGP